MFKKSLEIAQSFCIYIAILFLVLVAVYVLVMRTALHYLPEYQTQVIQYLNQQSELSIDVNSFSSHWDGFDPVLQLNGFKLGQEDPLYIGRISLNFSFIQSLIALQPKFDRILIEHSEIATRQNNNGHWEILGLSTEDLEQGSSNQTKENSLRDLLTAFNGTTINIKDLNATISTEKGSLRTLRLPNLNVNYNNDQLFVSGQVLENLGDMTLLNFSLKGRGLLSSGDIKGTLFVEARSDEFFGELLHVYDWQKVRVQDVEGSARAWLNFEGLNVTSIYGDILLSKVNWQADNDSLPPITNLALSYLWHNSEEKKQIEIYNLGLEWNSLVCDPINSKIIFAENNEINIFANKLNIQCATQMALALDIMPPRLQKRLTVSDPKGYLENINILVRPEKESISDIAIKEIDNESTSNSTENSVIGSYSVTEAENLSETNQDTDLVSSIVKINGIPLVNDDALKITLTPSESSFTLEAMLVDVDIQAYEGTPSGKNLNGYIYAEESSGYVSFLSDSFELGFPTLFLEPWALTTAEGKVSWEIKNHDVIVQSDGIRLWRKDGSLIYGDFILRLNDEFTEDYLSLALGMQDIPVQDAVKFVPFYVVSEGLYSWLTQSLIDGLVANGIYYGYGSVEAGKAENSFTSSIFLNTQKGVVQFDSAWPFLEDLDSDIFIQNGQLSIAAQNGIIAGTRMLDLSAFLPDKQEGEANYISISANASLTSELVNYWLSASPIANNTKNIVEQLTINSSALTDIKLKIPVADDKNGSSDELSYSVKTTITEGNILHIPSKLDFQNVNGSILVDSTKGVSANNIQTIVFDRPASLSIKTAARLKKPNTAKPINDTVSVVSNEKVSSEKVSSEKVSSEKVSNEILNAEQGVNIINVEEKKSTHSAPIKSTVTNISLKGVLGIDNVFEYFNTRKLAPLNGELLYNAELSISDEDNKYPLLTVKSNLIGVHCDCPFPLNKTMDQQADLSLSLLLKPEQTYLDANIVSNKLPLIDAELLFINDQLSFGEFLIGAATVKNTDIKGINIAAKMNEINLDSWLEFINQNFNFEEKTQQDNTSANLKQIQINAQQLNAFDHVFKDIDLNIKPLDDHWIADAKGKDIAGKIHFAQRDQGLNLNLEKLNLVPMALSTKDSINSSTEDPISLDPRTIPELSFSVENLSFEDRNVGSWHFDIKPDATGSLFRNIKGNIKGSNISGQLNWRFNDGIQSTIATIEVSGEDIATLFKAFDFPVLLTSNRYKSELALVWPNSPMNFDMSTLSGKALLDMEEGFLKTEDNKTGVLRLFGVLNAESIKRRLKLDFSDLYKSGVGYDTFNAKVSIDQGLLTLIEPLVIDGPAGRYVLNGRSDLGTKALDIDMLVELPFSQNVPLAALVLGAPQIGGLVWVADKLLGEPLSALTTSRYDISGTWDEPRVDLKQAMNASKKDRSKEKGARDVGK